MTATSVDDQLEAALDAATDDSARYHIREALQLRIAEEPRPDGEHPV